MKRTLIFMSAVLCLATAQAQAASRPALGIRMDDSTGGKTTAGVAIDSVMAGSPAAQAGLLAGDRISAIDNQQVSNPDDVIKIIAASSTNKQVTLNVNRGVWHASLPATLGDADQVFRAPAATPTVNTSCYYQNAGQCPTCQYCPGTPNVTNSCCCQGGWQYPSCQYYPANSSMNTSCSSGYCGQRHPLLYRWLSRPGYESDPPFIDGSQ
jgi:hypothetical protein